MDIYEIIRRWRSGQTISHIADALGYDRKTVRNYINNALLNGISKDKDLPSRQELLPLLKSIEKHKKHKQPIRSVLSGFKDEIIELVNNPDNPLKAKSAFEVICRKHNLEEKISYSSFKRYFKAECAKQTTKYRAKDQLTCRIETPPGRVVQIDYAKMGLLYDKHEQRHRTLYAFIATLSNSRHKFIEFVWKQDQTSFVLSNVKMLNFFGGSPEIISPDNLKSGVIKPDLYDPKINRVYNEFAEYYNIFIDPCRVRKPQDKGKVERDVQTVREEYKKLIALYPNLDINEANRLISKWIIEKYGQKEHGTTGLKPYETFIKNEKPKLNILPFKPFELAEWKKAKVHPDCFVQYCKQYYSVPYEYAGKNVWIRATQKIVSVYYKEEIIKQHIRTKNKRHTDLKDFPLNKSALLDENLPKYLIRQAFIIGPYFKTMIQHILNVHAWLSLRRAQGLLALKNNYSANLLEKGAKYVIDKDIIPDPKEFKRLLGSIDQYEYNSDISISKATQSYLRDARYFEHKKNYERN
jgi:transposase